MRRLQKRLIEMTRKLMIFSLVLATVCTHAQKVLSDNKSLIRFAGKYQFDGMVLQFGVQNNELVLVVPGAPLQRLKSLGGGRFRSRDFGDLEFDFLERNGLVSGVVSRENRGTFNGKKVADEAIVTSVTMDTLLVLTRSTDHFRFRYSAADTTVIDTLARRMEHDYNRILTDFHLKQIPIVTVRVYPDLRTFHLGINLPDGPAEILGTAFGKDDLRMVSPRNAGPQQELLAYALPHEFTHCVHLTIDYSPNNPRWLWEGVAQYEAGWFFNPMDAGISSKADFPTFDKLNNGLEYMLGYVMIEAIVKRWGFDTVIALIKNRGDVQKVLQIDQHQFEDTVISDILGKYAGQR
jgi:hypothetical protein